MTSASTEKKRRGALREEFGNPERRLAYYMILPSLLIILLIAFFPIMYSVVLSFTDSTVTAFGSFVGIENYVEMFQNPDFLVGLLNTVISAVMWRLMCQDQIGVIDVVANKLGVISEPILSDNTLLLISCILIDTWKTTPFMALLLLAGLQTIPADVYEAARVDGANVIQRFFRITMPLLKGTILVAVLFRTLDAYRVYDLFWVFSGQQLDSLSTFVFTGVRISQLLFAQGNAASVFVFVTSFLIALVFIKIFGMQTSTEE